MSKNFSDRDAILFGWNTLKDNLRFFILLLAAVLLINIVLTGISSSFTDEAPKILVFGVGIISWLVYSVVQLGLIRITLDFYDGRRPELKDLFRSYPLVLKYIVATLIYVLMVSVGMALLIVPGVYLMIKYLFYGYLIVDRGLGPKEALLGSGILTDGAKWDLLGFWLILLGVNLVGLLALGVGLFVTMPVTLLATAYVYRLLGSREAVAARLALPPG